MWTERRVEHGEPESIASSYDNAEKVLTLGASVSAFLCPWYKWARKNSYNKGCKLNIFSHIPIYLVKLIVLIPFSFCLMFSLLSQRSKKRKQVAENVLFHGNIVNIDEPIIEEDFCLFWTGTDISDEEATEYEERLSAEVQRGYNGDTQSIRNLVEELQEICTNDYSARMTSWIKVVPYAELSSMTECVFNVLRINMLRGTMQCALVFSAVAPNHLVKLDINEGPMTGFNMLHFCILNQDLKLLRLVLNRIPSDEVYQVLHQSPQVEALGVHESLGIEPPLLLAIWMGDTQVVRELVEAGAELTSRDSMGNNIFHITVNLEDHCPGKAEKMFDVLLSLIDVWIERTVHYAFLRNMTRRCACLYSQWMLLRSVNKFGLTPLLHAAKEGAPGLLSKIINTKQVYCFPHKEMGLLSTKLYDISEIDPFLTQLNATPSVLEILTMLPSHKGLQCLTIEPIASVADIKCKTWQPIYRVWGLSHFLFMIYLTGVLGHFMDDIQKTSSNKTLTGADKKLINNMDDPLFDNDHLIVIIAADVAIYTIVSLLLFHSNLKSALKITRTGIGLKYICGMMNAQLLVIPLYSASLLAYLVLMFMRVKSQTYFLAFSLLSGYFLVLLFMRSIKSLSFFSVMLAYIVKSDALQFALVFIILNLGFVACCLTIVAHYPTYLNMEKMLLNFIKLGSGITDFAHLYEFGGTYDVFLIAVYLLFVILVNVILLNMLIAAMSDSYAQVSNIRKLLGTKMCTADMILLEQIFPVFIQKYLTTVHIHKVLRVNLPNGKKADHHVYLLPAPTHSESEHK